MANTVAGLPIENSSIDGETLRSTDDTNAYSCCVSAVTDPFGTSWAFADNFGCLVLERETCVGLDQSLTKMVYTGTDFPQMTVGNANCGAYGWTYAK
jgi:hypothetical protein